MPAQLTMTAEEYKAKFGKKKNKFHAKVTDVDGIRFPSRAQADYYQMLKQDPELLYIEHEVTVTLPGNIRYRVDFKVWWKTFCAIHDVNDGCAPKPEAIEVKGKAMADFKIKRKLFDQFHPMRPLRVVKRQGRRWVEA